MNILALDDCDPEILDVVTDTQLVDVLICPPSADEPEITRDTSQKPMVITTGRLGKYIARLDIKIEPDMEPELKFQKVAVDETLPQSPELVQLYKDYQSMVKAENLLEKLIKVPLPDGLEYLGSNSCTLAPCHQYEFDIWSTKPHAGAYQTLVDVGSQYDPECIVCHVVGLEYETGFFNEKSPQDLRDVGCEVCHGPGSKHMTAILFDEADTSTSEPKITCVDCHTPDHRPDYAGNEDEFLEKITPWRELKDEKNVQ